MYMYVHVGLGMCVSVYAWKFLSMCCVDEDNPYLNEITGRDFSLMEFWVDEKYAFLTEIEDGCMHAMLCC